VNARKSSRAAFVARLLVVIAALAAIEALVAAGWVSPLFVSRPSSIFLAFIEMLQEGNLLRLTGITLFMVFVTFLSGATLGLPLGYLLWRRPRWGQAMENLLGSLFASPLILLYPVFLVIFGRSLTAIIAQALIVGIIPIILNTYSGLCHVNQTYLDVAATLRLGRGQVFRHILLPATAPAVFTGLRMGFIYMLLSILAMEYIVAYGGIGSMVSEAYFRLATDELYVGIAVTIFFSVLFFRLLLQGEKLTGRF